MTNAAITVNTGSTELELFPNGHAFYEDAQVMDPTLKNAAFIDWNDLSATVRTRLEAIKSEIEELVEEGRKLLVAT